MNLQPIKSFFHRFIRFEHNYFTIDTLRGADDHKAPLASETIARLNARRSIVVSRDLVAGCVLTANDITYKRPGTGISPLHWDEVIGRRAVRALAVDRVLQWSDLATVGQ